ncbi:MAG: channel protein TolC [Betaproteobacteria bacterium]|nr:channel protein TolC [Betaproteobacteria bacterium]NDD11086.1 channel protein TolC [Betaproteobacteria bacterium]
MRSIPFIKNFNTQDFRTMKTKLSLRAQLLKSSRQIAMKNQVAIVVFLGWIATPTHAFNLSQALDAAVRHDAVLASAEAQLRANLQKLPQSQSAFLPQINATASGSQQWAQTLKSPAGPKPSIDFQNYGLGVSLSQSIYRRVNVAQLEQSKLAINQAETSLAAARQDLLLRLAQAYFDVLGSQDALITLRAQERAIALQFEAAKRNFEVGTATITDQQEAQARLDLTKAQVAVAQNDLATKTAALSILIGEQPKTIRAFGPSVLLQAPEPDLENSWTQQAREQNFSVLLAKIGVDLARREIERQQAGKYPTVDLVSSASVSESPSAQLANSRFRNTSIGVQMSLPLYTGGAVESRIAEAVALQEKSRQDLLSAERAAEQSARTAFLGTNSLLAQVRALEAAERSSALALESNELGYQVGVRINIDVLNALQQLSTTRRDLSKARYDALLAGLRLKASTGSLGIVDIRIIDQFLKFERPIAVPETLEGTVFDAPVKVGAPMRKP